MPKNMNQGSVLVVVEAFRNMSFGMAEMLEFVYTQRREDLIKVNDIVNFIYELSHICQSC